MPAPTVLMLHCGSRRTSGPVDALSAPESDSASRKHPGRRGASWSYELSGRSNSVRVPAAIVSRSSGVKARVRAAPLTTGSDTENGLSVP